MIAERLDQMRETRERNQSYYAPRHAYQLESALRAALYVTADSLTEYPDDITALAVNRAITEALA